MGRPAPAAGMGGANAERSGAVRLVPAAGDTRARSGCDPSSAVVGSGEACRWWPSECQRPLSDNVHWRFCGLRRAEVLGLRFVSIRWFDNEIRVQYAITKRRCQDGIHKWEWYLGPPKTRKSLRGIAATESVMKLLADLKVGNGDSAFVFPGDCHGFIAPEDFEEHIWRPIVEAAGMTGTRFHDLRHFFASQLIANGETAAYIRDQMGHSSIH